MADRTVLVVDDSRVARMMTRAIIARLRETWTIIEAASGEDSLEAVKAAGGRVIDEFPRPGSRGTTVAFVHPKTSFGTLIELVQDNGVGH